MKKRYCDFLAYALTGILYIYSVVRATIIPTRAPVNSLQMLLFTMGAILFYCAVGTKPGLIVFLLASGSGLCYAAYLVFREGISNILQTFAPVIDLANVMIQVGTGYYDETISFSSLMIVTGVYTLIVALPVYLFVVRRFRFYAAFVPGLVFFMVVWGLNRFVDRFSFFIFVTVAVICFIRHTYVTNLKKSGTGSKNGRDDSMFVYFVPVAFLTVFLAAVIPVSEKPIEWPWLDRKIYDFWWDMQRKFTVDRYDVFSLSETGFGNPSRLGGPVYPNDTPVLRVQAPARVYLRGAVYDIYTGIGWERSEKSSEISLDERTYDHRELLYGWKAMSMMLGNLTEEEFNEFLLKRELSWLRKGFSKEEYIEFLTSRTTPWVLQKLFPENDISVEHLQLRTKSLFTPLKLFLPVTGLSDGRYILSESPEGIFQADKRLRRNSTYQVRYLQPAYGMKELENYFSLSMPGLYRNFNRNLRWYIENGNFDEQQNQQLEEVLEVYEDLEKYSDEMRRLYTQLPENLPERVVNLAREITYGYTNTYSKVKSLERFLRENFRYTLNPSEPLPDWDFVDYFLYEGREGYCSYFASALCVMTRAVGIPARYVEGFLPPAKSVTERSYTVTNQNAHAWVEVYLEGAGWITFEPTPPMANAQNYYVTLYTVTETEGTVPDMIEQRPQITGPGGVMPGEYELPGKAVSAEYMILISVTALILMVLLLNLFMQAAGRISIYLLPEKETAVRLYHRALRYLSQAGSTMKPGQTPKDFAELVDQRYNFKTMSMSAMTDIYYSVRFGTHDIGKDTVKRISFFVSEVKKETGRNMHAAKKIILRHLLFRG